MVLDLSLDPALLRWGALALTWKTISTTLALLLGAWLARDLGAPPQVHAQIDMRALDNLPVLAEQVMEQAREQQSLIVEGGFARVA